MTQPTLTGQETAALAGAGQLSNRDLADSLAWLLDRAAQPLDDSDEAAQNLIALAAVALVKARRLGRG